ncbi:MAG: hypothetical protein GX096_13395 [Clostridiales bacterium]|nr:hypothetical protein [Clostridiales bacterium]
MNLKEKYKYAFEEITPDQTLYSRTQNVILVKTKPRNSRKITSRTVVLAVMLSLILFTAVAFATGWAQSIFAGMRGNWSGGRDFEAMEELAQNQFGTGSVAFTNDPSMFDFQVMQAYYDGEQLVLATAWNGVSDVVDLSFGPQSTHFDDLQLLDWETASDVSPQDEVSVQAWADFERIYDAKGAAGMMYYSVYPGDGVYMGDIQLPPKTGDSDVLEDGRHWAYTEYESPLPSAAQQRESLELTVRLYRVPVYYYRMGDDQTYRYVGEREQVDFAFVVSNNHAASRTLTQPAAFAQYEASAVVTLTAIGAAVEIYIEAPDAWKHAAVKDDYGERQISGVDYVLSYGAYVDDEPQQLWMEESNAEYFKGSFELPAEAKKLILRPIYSLSGERADEDILIELN